MAEAMQNTAKAMAKMNKAVDAKTIAKMMAEFERENMKTELMQEVMGDAIDDALADDEAEEEQEKIVNQVLDEIGVTFGEGTSHDCNKHIGREVMLNSTPLCPFNRITTNCRTSNSSRRQNLGATRPGSYWRWRRSPSIGTGSSIEQFKAVE